MSDNENETKNMDDSSKQKVEASTNTEDDIQILNGQVELNQNDVKSGNQSSNIDWAAASETQFSNDNNVQIEKANDNKCATSTPAISPNSKPIPTQAQPLPNNNMTTENDHQTQSHNKQQKDSNRRNNKKKQNQNSKDNQPNIQVQHNQQGNYNNKQSTFNQNQQNNSLNQCEYPNNQSYQQQYNSNNQNYQQSSIQFDVSRRNQNYQQQYNTNSQNNQQSSIQFESHSYSHDQSYQQQQYNSSSESYQQSSNLFEPQISSVDPNYQQQYIENYFNQHYNQYGFIEPQPTLFIDDLDASVTSQMLKKFFNRNGGVTSVIVPAKKDEKGVFKKANFAFINFNSWDALLEVINSVQFIKYKEKYMRLMIYDPRIKQRKSNGEGNVYVMNLPPNINPQIVFDCFIRYGNILSLKVGYF